MEFRECVPPVSNLFVTWKKYSFDFRSCLENFVKKERKVVRRNSWIREIIHSISYLFSESSILKFVLKFFFFFFRYPFVIFLFSSIENIPHPRFLSSILLSPSFFLPPLFFASFSPIVLHFFHPPRFSSYLHTISTLFPPLSRN